jgi:hypothetical protein
VAVTPVAAAGASAADVLHVSQEVVVPKGGLSSPLPALARKGQAANREWAGGAEGSKNQEGGGRAGGSGGGGSRGGSGNAPFTELGDRGWSGAEPPLTGAGELAASLDAIGGGGDEKRQQAVGELTCLCEALRVHQLRLRANRALHSGPPSPCLLDASTLTSVPALALQLGLPHWTVHQALVDTLNEVDGVEEL